MGITLKNPPNNIWSDRMKRDNVCKICGTKLGKKSLGGYCDGCWNKRMSHKYIIEIDPSSWGDDYEYSLSSSFTNSFSKYLPYSLSKLNFDLTSPSVNASMMSPAGS